MARGAGFPMISIHWLLFGGMLDMQYSRVCHRSIRWMKGDWRERRTTFHQCLTLTEIGSSTHYKSSTAFTIDANVNQLSYSISVISLCSFPLSLSLFRRLYRSKHWWCHPWSEGGTEVMTHSSVCVCIYILYVCACVYHAWVCLRSLQVQPLASSQTKGRERERGGKDSERPMTPDWVKGRRAGMDGWMSEGMWRSGGMVVSHSHGGQVWNSHHL